MCEASPAIKGVTIQALSLRKQAQNTDPVIILLMVLLVEPYMLLWNLEDTFWYIVESCFMTYIMSHANLKWPFLN